MEQKIKQDEIFIGQNIRRIRKEKGIRQTEMVALMQLQNVPVTREALVKIEGEYSIYRHRSLEQLETYWKQRMMNC